jgi:hypothetical protein
VDLYARPRLPGHGSGVRVGDGTVTCAAVRCPASGCDSAGRELGRHGFSIPDRCPAALVPGWETVW